MFVYVSFKPNTNLLYRMTLLDFVKMNSKTPEIKQFDGGEFTVSGTHTGSAFVSAAEYKNGRLEYTVDTWSKWPVSDKVAEYYVFEEYNFF